MDIIIPYIESSSDELRYALRSICLYQPHDRIIIAGDLPKWCTAHNIKSEYVLGRPEFDVTKKILTASKVSTEDFILWQDDIYKLKEGEIKPVYCDTLKDALIKRQEGRLKGIIENTVSEFPEGYYYGGHTPMVMNGKLMAEAVEKHWKRDLIPKSMYGNYAQIGGELMPDCKIRGAARYEMIKEFIEGKDYFSTGHFSVNNDMLIVLNELFPEKCKYEK